jgi:hypothetical protein
VKPQSKLSSSARHLLAGRGQPGGLAQTDTVSILLRGKGKFDPGQMTALKADGVHIRTVAGDVLSADVPLDALSRVEGHDFVTSIEISTPLYTEERERSAPLSDVE